MKRFENASKIKGALAGEVVGDNTSVKDQAPRGTDNITWIRFLQHNIIYTETLLEDPFLSLDI